MIATLDGSKIFVDGWSAPGVVQCNQNVKFADGGQWTLLEDGGDIVDDITFEEFAFDAQHDVEGKRNDWRGPLFFGNDGTFHRKDRFWAAGDAGVYEVKGVGSTTAWDIVLRWDRHEAETLTTDDFGKSFENEAGFKLNMPDGTPPAWFLNKFPHPGRRNPLLASCYQCCP